MIKTKCIYIERESAREREWEYCAPCSYIILSSLQQYSKPQSHYHWGFLENKVLSHFLLPFFFSSKKRTLFVTYLCQMWCFPYFMFWVWKGSGPLGPSSIHLFLRTLLTLKTLDWCLVQAQASGWQGPNPCHVNPHWMAGDSNLAVHGIVRWALFPSQLWLHLKP